MAEVAGYSVLHVDPGALEDFAGHVDGVHDRIAGVQPPSVDEPAMGSPRVADALHAFTRAVGEQQERVVTQLATLTRATRNAASEYANVDGSFTSALSSGDDS